MDILIKNMEMPVDHGIFLVICPDGTIEQKVGNADNGYPIYHIVKDAKAVALPEHGRLCDLDALKSSVADMRMEKPLRNGAKQVIEIGELFGRIIDDAPVIVEANNE